jgi:hypothetical protein
MIAIDGEKRLILLGEAFSTGNYTKTHRVPIEVHGGTKSIGTKARLLLYKSYSTNNNTVRLVKAFAKSTKV